MVEHNLSVVANLSDRITVLTRGRVLAEGDYAMVSPSPQVREAYLGVGHDSAVGGAASLLAVEDLQAWYGEVPRAARRELRGRRGEVVTLLGRNGAGKTTTLKSIMGMVAQAHRLGHSSRGASSSRLASNEIARAGIAYLPGGARHLREPRRRGEPDAAAAWSSRAA